MRLETRREMYALTNLYLKKDAGSRKAPEGERMKSAAIGGVLGFKVLEIAADRMEIHMHGNARLAVLP